MVGVCDDDTDTGHADDGDDGCDDSAGHDEDEA